MKTVSNDIAHEIIINKSRFICILCQVKNESEINNKINYYKNKYKDATHYCTAYIIENHEKCNDDKEPKGTAGIPILNVLKNNELNNILAIVIRYFGGIKLGAGGLIRAYSKSVRETLKIADIIKLVNGYLIKINIQYNDIKYFDNLLKKYKIEKKFAETITYSFLISEKDLKKINDIIKNNIIFKEPRLIKA